MNCNEALSFIDCYHDGELDAPRAQEIESHLEICAPCAQSLESRRSLHRALTAPELYAHANRKTVGDIRSALRRCAAGRSSPQLTWWRWFAPGAAALSLAALVFLVVHNDSIRRETLVVEIAASHVRSLQVNHLTDVASEDRHTVKPWFAGKLDFAPPVKDLSDAGFVLIGGRVDYLNHRAVAALIYKHQQHVVNVFVWPRENHGDAPSKAFIRDGFNVVHWTGTQMNFWAVSDLNSGELGKLERLLNE